MPTEDRFSRKALATLLVLCVAPFLGVVDTTIVTIALPSMSAALGLSATDAQWVLNGYALAYGGLLLLLGRVADLWGRRRLFLLGLAVFAAASLLGGLAPAPWVLIVARVAQGVGAATFTPAALSLVATVFREGPARNRALGVYGAMAAVGFVVGMVLGGVLTELLGWRWVFLLNVPIAVLVLLAAPATLPESRSQEQTRSLDFAGAATVTLALGATIFAVSAVAESGWRSALTLGAGVLGIAAAIGFVIVERRSAAPLVPLALLRTRRVAVPNGLMLLISTIGTAWLYVLTFYFQDVRALSPLPAGLLFLPMTIASIAGAWAGGRMVTASGVKVVILAGSWLVGGGLLLMSVLPLTGSLLVVVAGMIVGEIGFMMTTVALTIAITASARPDQRGLASGLLGTATQLGNALGLSVTVSVAAITAATVAGTPGVADRLTGLRWGLWVSVVVAALTCLIALIALRRSDYRSTTRSRQEVSRSVEPLRTRTTR